MFQKIYKNQKRNLLRNWGVLNNRAVNNNKQCKKQQPVENRLVVAPKQTLPALDNVNLIYAGRHYEYFTRGPWIHCNQLNFWGVFGLSAAVITGIRYGNLKRKLKYHQNVKPSEQFSSVGSWAGSYVLINPFTKVQNLFSEYNILCAHGLTTLSKICLQKQTRLSILPEAKKSSIIFDTGNSSISDAIVPSGREISEPSPTTAALNKPIDDLSSTSSKEPVDHELSESSGLGEDISSKQTSIKSRSSLSSYSFLSSDSFAPTFTHSVAPFSRFITQSHVPNLDLQKDIKVASEIKIDNSEKISLAIGDLVKLLSDTMGDVLADETCNMATELARDDDYKRAIDIWNSILLKNPIHGKTLYNLATCFENGLGVKRNIVKAKELYEKASNVNHARSSYRLARIHLREWKHGSQTSLPIYQDYLSKSASFGFMKADEELKLFLSSKGPKETLLQAVKPSRTVSSLNAIKPCKSGRKREPSWNSSSDEGSIEFSDDINSHVGWMPVSTSSSNQIFAF